MLIPILTLLASDKLKEVADAENHCGYCSIGDTPNCLCCFQNKEKPLVRSAIWFCYLLMIIEASFVYAMVSSSSERERKYVPLVFYGTISVIALECLIMTFISLTYCTEWGETMPSWNRLPLIVCITLGVYHLCWVAIGIMINPTWGLSIFLIISFLSVALFFVIHEMSNVEECKSSLFLQRCVVALCSFFGICLAFSAPLLVGQSFYGRETADDILKMVLLFVIDAVIVLFYKSYKPSTNNSVADAAETGNSNLRTVPSGEEHNACNRGRSSTEASESTQLVAPPRVRKPEQRNTTV